MSLIIKKSLEAFTFHLQKIAHCALSFVEHHVEERAKSTNKKNLLRLLRDCRGVSFILVLFENSPHKSHDNISQLPFYESVVEKSWRDQVEIKISSAEEKKKSANIKF